MTHRVRLVHFVAALLIATASAPSARAQTSANAPLSLEDRLQERTQRLAEQRQPRTAVPFDPGQFGKYAGIYQRAPYEFFTISRQGEHFILGLEAAGLDKSVDLEVYPESPTKFFVKEKPIQISFTPDARGNAPEFVLHASGFEFHVPKVDESVVKKAMAAAAARIKNKTPRPGSEGKLRRFIEGFQHGQPNYDEMHPESAVMYRMDLFQKYAHQFQKLGALKSLTFAEVTPRGEDKYVAVYEHGRADMTIDLNADDKIDAVQFGEVKNQ